MLTAAKIEPLASFYEPPTALKPLTPNKEVALSINLGSIFCLCDAPKNRTPQILQTFRVESLYIDPQPRSPEDNKLRWTLVDGDGRWWDGSMSQLDLYKGLCLIQPEAPLRTKHSTFGLRAVFKFHLPRDYRVHHLAYLRKHFPRALSSLRIIT
jgi:hypothetical protein